MVDAPAASDGDTRAPVTWVGDGQFLRSVIPHHSIAIEWCGRSDITDPELLELCRGIVASQQAEIDQMNRILDRLR